MNVEIQKPAHGPRNGRCKDSWLSGQRPKGGHRIGFWHHKAKLTDENVRDMRYDRQRWGTSYEALGVKYGCGTATARDIVKYRTRGDA